MAYVECVTIVDHRRTGPRIHFEEMSDAMKIVVGLGLAMVVAFAVFAALFTLTRLI